MSVSKHKVEQHSSMIGATKASQLAALFHKLTMYRTVKEL